jgi:hypothetical protein
MEARDPGCVIPQCEVYPGKTSGVKSGVKTLQEAWKIEEIYP